MRILVTGGSGFIGAQLCATLQERGHEVISVDDHRVLPLAPSPSFEVRTSVEDLSKKDLEGFDVVYHLASNKSIPESFERPISYLDNAEATANLLHCARQAGVERIFIGSTCEVFGDQPQQPLLEDALLAPRSPYAMTKAISEMYSGIYSRASETRIVVVRIFNTYGPYERPDAVVPAMCRDALREGRIVIEGSGEQKRDFTYIDDMVQKLASLMEVSDLPSAVNLGSGKSTSIQEIAQLVQKIALEHGDPTSIDWRSSRINEISDFQSSTSLQNQLNLPKPQIDLSEGVLKTYLWWKEYLNHD
ncbi:NAD-dependent epimerase/dehydratase family protein [Corynebacterium striatum]